jgi:signal transduction histidine kinase
MRPSRHARARRLVLLLAASAGAWAAVAVVFAAAAYLTSVAIGRPEPWWWIVGYYLACFSLWVALGPVTVWVTRRLRRERRWPRQGAGHLLAGAAVALAQCVGFALLYWPLFNAGGALPDRLSLLRKELYGGFLHAVLVYVLVAGGTTVLDAMRALHRREVEALTLEARLARAEAAALRHQRQPHFLFNALHSIASLVPGRPRQAQTLIADLAALLRLSLDSHGADETTLAAELAFADAYLAIEAARLGDRLRVVRDVAPDLLDAAVPALLLQPLVENAVRHGIAPVVGGGTLRIAASRDGDRVCLAVEDDGQGAAVPTSGSASASGTRARGRPSCTARTTRSSWRARRAGASACA